MEKKFLIEPSELIDLLKSPIEKLARIRILDGTRYLPVDTRDIENIFPTYRIPYSILFNQDKIANFNVKTPKNTPHMVPDNETFIKFMKELDIRKSDEIIIYDRLGIYGSPRLYMLFYWFGHKNVKILNGGMPLYEKLNGEFEKDNEYKVKILNEYREKNIKVEDDDFNYSLDKSKIYYIEDLVKNKLNEQIVDARNEDRYLGKVKEPRPSLRVGHVTGAKHLFYKDVLDKNDRFLGIDELKEVFKNKNIDIDKGVICYCGTGLVANCILMAMCMLGKADNAKLYDASWDEYGNLTEEDIQKIKEN